jgi:hypothetical protein
MIILDQIFPLSSPVVKTTAKIHILTMDMQNTIFQDSSSNFTIYVVQNSKFISIIWDPKSVLTLHYPISDKLHLSYSSKFQISYRMHHFKELNSHNM